MPLPRAGDEVAAADLDHDTAGREPLCAQPGAHPVGEVHEFRAKSRWFRDVRSEGLLCADLLLVPVRHDGLLVDAGCALPDEFGMAAEYRAQLRHFCKPQLAERANAQRLDPGRRLRAQPGQPADRQRVEYRVDLGGAHDDESVGLLEVGGDLGHELVRRHADRCCERGSLADHALDLPRDPFPVSVQRRARRDVEESLVQRQSLHQRRELVEDAEDLARNRLVVRHPRRDAQGLRAAAQGFAHRHGRAHAKAAHLVARGRDDTPCACAAHDHGAAAQRCVVALFDGCIKGIHVHVQDHPPIHSCSESARLPVPGACGC
jgi:hypothetical protein